MFVFQKVRARNFARAWGCLQAAQGLPLLIGLPTAHYITAAAWGGHCGIGLSGVAMILGSGLLFLIQLHKRQLRRLRHNRRHGGGGSVGGNSVRSTSTTKTTMSATNSCDIGGDSYASPEPGGGRGSVTGEAARRNRVSSYKAGEEEEEEEGEEEEDEEDIELIPALAQFSNQQCLLQLLDHYKVRSKDQKVKGHL